MESQLKIKEGKCLNRSSVFHLQTNKTMCYVSYVSAQYDNHFESPRLPKHVAFTFSIQFFHGVIPGLSLFFIVS